MCIRDSINTAPSARVGVAVRFQDKDNYLFCKMVRDTGRLLLGRFQSGFVTTIDAVDFAPAAGTDVQLQLSVSGNQLTCGASGASRVLGGTDGTWATGSPGLLGDGDVDILSTSIRG